MVADAPYGVAHGSRTPRAACPARPLDLLGAAVPVLGAAAAARRRAGHLLEHPRRPARARRRRCWPTPGWRLGRRLPDLAHRVDQAHRARHLVARETRVIRPGDGRTRDSPCTPEPRVFDLLLPGDSRSLKAKRSYVRPIVAALRKFEVAVAEVGALDLHGRAEIGVAVVAAEAGPRARGARLLRAAGGRPARGRTALGDGGGCTATTTDRARGAGCGPPAMSGRRRSCG